MEPITEATPEPTDGEMDETFEDAEASDAGDELDLECRVLTATVTAVEDDVLRLDLGNDEIATMPAAELGEAAAVGASAEVFVERSTERNGGWVASKTKADKLRLFEQLVRAADGEGEVEGDVVAKVKGGLSVDIGVRAFLPASQIDLRPVHDLDPYVGQRLTFNILKFNKKRGNAVLTRRKVVERERAQLKKETLARLVEGEVVQGVVRSFTEFGAFVDLGGVDGLVHLSELSWGRIKHPSEAVKVGESVRVKVLEIQRGKGRISLGYRQLLEDPWSRVEEKYPPGGRVKGEVVSLTDYGAFVELEPGVEGLVHVSELSWTKRPRHPREVLSQGDTVEAVVLGLDLAQRRISLGIKQTTLSPWIAFAEQNPAGTQLRGVVSGVKEFGVFVELPENGGLEGLVHVSDISWTERVKTAVGLYEVGAPIEVKVVDVDIGGERLSLGIKQLTQDPWAVARKKLPVGTKVKGKVTRTADFGAFIAIDPELVPDIEGLCHISQLSTDRVERVTDVVKVGDELELVVIDLDAKRQRLSLSIKAMSETSEDFHGYMNDVPAETPFGNFLGVALADKLARDAAASRAASAAPNEADRAGTPSDEADAAADSREASAGDEEPVS